MNLFAELCLLKNESYFISIGPLMDCLRKNASREVSWFNLKGFQSTKMIYQSNSDKKKMFIHKKSNSWLLSTWVPVGLKNVFCCLPCVLFPMPNMKNNLILNTEHQLARISPNLSAFSIDFMASTKFFAHPVTLLFLVIHKIIEN